MFGPGEYVSDPTEGIIDVNDLPKPIFVLYDCNHDHSPCPRCGHLASDSRKAFNPLKTNDLFFGLSQS
jgi:hypothetical protein